MIPHHQRPIALFILFCSIAGLLPKVCFPQPEKLTITLEDAINRALFSNRDIASALDRVSISSYSLSATRSEFELKIVPEIMIARNGTGPNYGLGLALNQKLPFGTNVAVSPVISKSGGQYNSGFEFLLNQPLLRGIKSSYNLFGVKNSEYNLKTARWDLFLMQTEIILSTTSAVYDVIRNRHIFELQRSSYDRTKGYLEAALVKQKMGIASALDVYRAKIKLTQVESALISSQDTYQDSLDNLKIILTLPLELDIELTAPLTYNILKLPESEAIATAMKERPELEEAHDMISNLALQTDVAKHNLLPDLNLQIRYTALGLDRDLGRSLRNVTGRFEFGLSASRDARKSAERAEYAISKLSIRGGDRLMSQRQDDIKREVKFALRNLNRAEKNIDIQNEQIKQSRGKLELAKIKFSHSYANNYDIMEAETELRQAEINLISAVTEYIVGLARLKAATGTLIDKKIILDQ
jgi:outer membrane protein TolC